MKLYNSANEINKAIDSIGRRGAKLDADIQLTGLSCLQHIEKHGDVTLLCRLYLNMPKGARRNALVAWALAHGKVSVNTDKDTKKDLPMLYNREASTDLVGADEQPWYSFKQEKAPDAEFDFELAYANLIKRAMAASKSGLPIKGAELFETVKLAGGIPA